MVEIQLNSLRHTNEAELLEVSESSEIITEVEEQTLVDNSEKSDILESKDLSNICNFCKKTFCNEKYLQIHISKQHKFL